VLWLFGVCGGGDVKLAAALGAWLGWQYLIYVFAVSVGVVAFFLMLKIVGGGVGPGAIRTTLKRRPKLESPGGLVRKSQRRRLTLSMPLAVSTLVVTLWLFRYDLGLAERPMTAAERQRAHELSVYNA
jgi:prepilin signal peptidase PulO-like enzyme (type II secretory pathway)